MKHLIRIIFVTVLLFGTIALVTGCGNTTAQNTSPTPTNSTTANSVSVKSKNGLSLALSLDSTTYQTGQNVSIVIDETNTLSTTNKVTASNKWPLSGLSVSPCGTLNYPFGIAIFQGYYTAANFAAATPLKLYDPGARYNCPMILSGITAYNFESSSDTASILGSCEPEPCLTTQMNAAVTATGYWAGSPTATQNSFAPGVYTVLGGDEWGATVILHFTVVK